MIYVEFKAEEPEGEEHIFLVEMYSDEIVTIQRDREYVSKDEYKRLRDDMTFLKLVDDEVERQPLPPRR